MGIYLDVEEKEMRAAELKAILSKPANRKSILKMNTDSPKTPGKVQLKTIADEAPATPKAGKTAPVAKKIETAEPKTPAKEQAKSTNKATPAALKAEKEIFSPKVEALQAVASPVKEGVDIKTPVKVKAQTKTPAKNAPATPKPVATETIAQVTVAGTEVSSPVKAAVPETPKSNKKEAKLVKSPAEKPKEVAAIPSPKKTSSETTKTEEAPSSTPKEDQTKKTKKAAKAEKKKAMKEAALKSEAEKSSVGAKSTDKVAKLVEAIKTDSKGEFNSSTSTHHERQLLLKANEERFEDMRRELLAQGKSAEEVTSEMRHVCITCLFRVQNWEFIPNYSLTVEFPQANGLAEQFVGKPRTLTCPLVILRHCSFLIKNLIYLDSS